MARSGIRDSTTVIIVGDHGFSDIKRVLRPNVWIKDTDARFQPAGGAAFLYTRDQAATQQVKNILNKLSNTYKKLFHIYDRPKLNTMGPIAARRLHLLLYQALYSADL